MKFDEALVNIEKDISERKIIKGNVRNFMTAYLFFLFFLII